MTKFNEAFQELVQDMYSAEKQVLMALPKAAKASTSPELVSGIEHHIKQTEMHATRLEEVAKRGGFKPTGKVCTAAKGIIEEISDAIKEHPKGPVLDAVLVSGCQKFEHYEMANYGTAVSWAELMGHKEDAHTLHETLVEEKDANAKLTAVAKTTVNKAAMSSQIVTAGR